MAFIGRRHSRLPDSAVPRVPRRLSAAISSKYPGGRVKVSPPIGGQWLKTLTILSSEPLGLDHPGVRVVVPTARHWAILEGLIVDSKARGPLVSDAHLAALAIEHGATLYTTDRDFSRFDGLLHMNPIADSLR